MHKVDSTDKSSKGINCHRCGVKGHKAPSCRFKNARCYKCGKVGHIKRVCCSKGKPTRKNHTCLVHCVTEGDEEPTDEYHLFSLGSSSNSPPVKVEVVIDNKPVSMEIDTGVGPSLGSEATFKERWPDRILSPSTVRLRTYSGEPITVLGMVNADVQYKEQKAQLLLLVVQCEGPSLLGRSWLQCFQLDWQDIHSS